MPPSPPSRGNDRRLLALCAVLLIALASLLYLRTQPFFIDAFSRPSGRVEAPAAALSRLTCQDGVLLDGEGREVALFGVNFQTPLSWEYKYQYRPAGIPLDGPSLNKLTDEHLSDLKALRAEIVRAHLAPADFADAQGNLRPSPYLEALEHLLARCGEEGIRVYLTLINEQGEGYFADSFMAGIKRDQWLVDPAFLTKAETFITALLQHVNPRTGRRIVDEPALALIEPVNEPAYPKPFESRKAAVAEAIERLYQAIRIAGAQQPVIWNLNWPGMMWNHRDVFEAVAESRVEGVSFCLYPGQNDIPQTNFWDYPQDLSGNNYLPYLRKVLQQEADLGWTMTERFRGKAKLVYEFETFFNESAHLYPAMAAVFRQMGVQVACMWHYRLLPAALLQGGSHYLNLYTTPRKALSFEAASLVFQNTPLFLPAHFDSETRMSGPHWFADAERDLAVYDDGRIWISTNETGEGGLAGGPPRESIAGWRKTPWIAYGGSGAFSCDAWEDGWQLVLKPDVEFLRPFWQKAQQKGDVLCRLRSDVAHRLVLNLPGMRPDEIVLSDGAKVIPSAEGGTVPGSFDVPPGTYQIRRAGGFLAR